MRERSIDVALGFFGLLLLLAIFAAEFGWV